MKNFTFAYETAKVIFLLLKCIKSSRNSIYNFFLLVFFFSIQSNLLLKHTKIAIFNYFYRAGLPNNSIFAIIYSDSSSALSDI